MDATVVLGQQGRLVIPSDMRAALRLRPGQALHLHVEDGQLVLEPASSAAARLRGLARAVTGRSLVDELLAERRHEAAT